MSAAPAPARPPGAVELLERAVSYSRGSLLLVSVDDLVRATPCAGWSLADLLRHMDDSLAAMAEAAQGSRLGLVPGPVPEDGRALLDSICHRARGLLAAWHPSQGDAVGVGGHPLARELVGSIGALEITLHGWDVAQSLGRDRPIPPALAMDLWPLARDHVTEADRPVPFGPALEVPDWASPQERLLAHTGRRCWGL